MWIWVFFFTLLFLIWYSYRPTQTHNLLSERFNDSDTKIPKLIWSYWDSINPPPLVQQCITSWKKLHPDYTITVLTNDTLSTYLPHINVLAFPLANYPQRISDFIRIHILAEYGGVWADASLLMNERLDWIHEDDSSVVVYSIDHITTPLYRYPVIENWFIACTPNNDFIIKWRDEFVLINRFKDGESYLADLKQRGTNLETIFCTPYLTMHAAAQYVFQIQGSTEKIRVLDAREGPYKHLRFNTNPLTFEQGIPNLCNDPKQPIVKFRGIDREYISNHPEQCACINNFFV
jgi:hypothetical protein